MVDASLTTGQDSNDDSHRHSRTTSYIAEVTAREIGRVTIAEALELTATISTPKRL